MAASWCHWCFLQWPRAGYQSLSQSEAASLYSCVIVEVKGFFLILFLIITKSFSLKVPINLCHLFFYCNCCKYSLLQRWDIYWISWWGSLFWFLANCSPVLRSTHRRSGNVLELKNSGHLNRMTKEWYVENLGKILFVFSFRVSFSYQWSTTSQIMFGGLYCTLL